MLVQMSVAASVKQAFMLHELYPFTGKEVLPMAETVNSRKLTADRKREALSWQGTRSSSLSPELAWSIQRWQLDSRYLQQWQSSQARHSGRHR